jgi:crotonobetainyl-CoA:carnitine CoA-transferase CaiB-like acyl-CoA transferase
LRVLDFGWVWSAPWVGAILGELGAEVIKVEHRKRPDNLRLAGRVMRNGAVVEGPSMEMSPMYHQINHGKLGITLNTKKPAAVELIKRHAALSDVVIENMSPGSLERSELGYADLSAIKPDIVMLAMSVAGQHGALSALRA